jgi:cell shape-determining protein MreD
MNRLPITFVLLTIYVAVFAQSTLAGTRFLGAQVDLLPGLIVYSALTFSPTVIVCIALFGALLFDTLSANPLGASVLPLLCIAAIVFRNQEFLLRQHAYAQFILGCAASAIAPVLTIVILLGLGQQPLLGLGSVWQIIVMAFTGGLATPVWFWVFGRLSGALHYPVVVESSFRQDREIARGRH